MRADKVAWVGSSARFIWRSRLDDVRAAEALLYRCRERMLEAYARLKSAASRLEAAGGVAHVYVQRPGQAGDWREWREATVRPSPISYQRDDGSVFGWIWLDAVPEPVRNPDLGTEIQQREDYYYYSTLRRLALMRSAFVAAVDKRLREEKIVAYHIQLTVNGRVHLWAAYRGRYSVEYKPVQLFGEGSDETFRAVSW